MYFIKTNIAKSNKTYKFREEDFANIYSHIEAIHNSFDEEGYPFITVFYTPMITFDNKEYNYSSRVIEMITMVTVSKANINNPLVRYNKVKEFIEKYANETFPKVDVDSTLISITEFSQYMDLIPKKNSRFYLKRLSDYTNKDLYMGFESIYKDIPTYMSFKDYIVTENNMDKKWKEFQALNGNSLHYLIHDKNVFDYSYSHNKVFKCIARSKNHIRDVIDPLVTSMWNYYGLTNKSYYVLDMNTIVSYENVGFSKLNNIINTLGIGSTIVIWIDIPNILYDDIELVDDPESDVYHKSDRKFYDDSEEDRDDDEPREDNSEEKKQKEKMIERKYKRYTEMLTKYDIARSVVSDNQRITDFKFSKLMISSLLSMKEYTIQSLPKELSNIITMVLENYRQCNFVLCYSDTIAYSKNEFFDFLIPKLTREHSGLYPLANIENMFKDEDSVDAFIENTVDMYFENLTESMRNEVIDNIKDKIHTRIKSGIKDNSAFHFLSSVPMFTYFICTLATDILNEEYNEEEDNKFDKEMSNSIKKAMEAEAKRKLNNKARDIMEKTYSDDQSDDYESDFSDFYTDDRSETKYKKKTDSNGTDVNSLDEMIGLTTVKQQIKDFASFMTLNELKKKRELEVVSLSRHMIFTGNPGTAKTTVAMLLAHILYENHTIARDNVVIVGRDQLVGKYVGWTAKNVEKYISEAKGGILFVDEAYSLVDNVGSNSYGKEAIDTFVRYMDDKQIRDTTIIIFAGYKKEMLEFCESNPGMRSRIGFIIDFPDYTTDELIDIAKLQAKNKGLILSNGFLDEFRKTIEVYKKEKSFGNGRFVRSILEKSMMKQARRLVDKYGDRLDSISDNILLTLRKEDFSEFGIKKTDTKKIGFGI